MTPTDWTFLGFVLVLLAGVLWVSSCRHTWVKKVPGWHDGPQEFQCSKCGKWAEP